MDDPWRILGVLGTDATLTGLFCAAKAAGVLAVAGLVALAMRRRAAATRHLVWGLGLAGALAVLPLTLALPRWRLPVLSAPAKAELPMVLSHNVDIRQADGPAVVDIRMTPSEAPASSPSPQVSPNELNVTEAPPMVAWPLVVWGAGTLAVLVWGAARLGVDVEAGAESGERHRPGLGRSRPRCGRPAGNTPGRDALTRRAGRNAAYVGHPTPCAASSGGGQPLAD